MKPFLLDINVLLALAFHRHAHHAPARHWLERKHASGIRTCPFTEAGFVRIASNPAFSPDAVPTGQALLLLDQVRSLPHWGFWPLDLTLAEATQGMGSALTHRTVTDAYLLSLAKSKGGVLATLDRGVLGLPGASEDCVALLY